MDQSTPMFYEIMIDEEETQKPNQCLRFATLFYSIMSLLFTVGILVAELAIHFLLENSGKYAGTNFLMVLIECLTSCLALTSLLGIVGAYLENRQVLISFVSFLTIFSAAGLTIGIVLLTKPDVAFPYAKPFFQKYISVANSDTEDAFRTSLMSSMRALQQKLKCCGFGGPEDFQNATLNCCEPNTNCEADEMEGCKDRILVVVETLSQIIGGIDLIIMTIAIIFVICTIILIIRLKGSNIKWNQPTAINLKFLHDNASI